MVPLIVEKEIHPSQPPPTLKRRKGSYDVSGVYHEIGLINGSYRLCGWEGMGPQPFFTNVGLGKLWVKFAHESNHLRLPRYCTYYLKSVEVMGRASSGLYLWLRVFYLFLLP